MERVDPVIYALAAVWLLALLVGALLLGVRAHRVSVRARLLEQEVRPALDALVARGTALAARGAAAREDAEHLRRRERELRGGLDALAVLRRAVREALLPLDLLRGRG